MNKYIWHDLIKDPNDYPEVYDKNTVFNVIVEDGGGLSSVDLHYCKGHGFGEYHKLFDSQSLGFLSHVFKPYNGKPLLWRYFTLKKGE